ncbi:hypothetical protein [Rhodospirillum centenum]|uniref:Lipoprotein n=1 Tax=Rhodospirillum centenum (strain ATCC 51521 / SW) TaxID=414684 RepID=B6IMP6_RHOCS|nr:hypothetical protein [Rhodospirillum centenum]ACI98712.1 hypothetical protein RC1_1307 [Rhodospirillum centenum SW]
MRYTGPFMLNRFRALAALPLLALLGGCADVRLPRIVFADGPAPARDAAAAGSDPQAVLTGQRPVRRADPTVTGYPNLASVPARPTEFSTPGDRQALLDRLQADRDSGDATAADLRARPVGGGAASSAGTAATPPVPEGPPPVPQPIDR